jgi:hypothetical protein
MCLRRWKKQSSRDKGPDPGPTGHVVIDIRVPDDGFTLTGRRYPAYIAEVKRRQDTGAAQVEVTVWHRHPDNDFADMTVGLPRIDKKGDLEILTRGKAAGTVRKVGGHLRYFPS